MTKSPTTKPPVSKTKVRARLERAQSEKSLVHIRRWIPEADGVEGFIVGLSRGWVLLHRLNDRVAFDGWIMLRLEDVQAVTIYPPKDCFEIAALKARGLWPPSKPDGKVPQTINQVLDLAAGYSVVSVHREFTRPDICWCGAVRAVDDGTLTFLDVTTDGHWAARSRRVDLEDVTRVDFGGGYEEALALVAGPPRRRRTARSSRAG